MKHLASLLAVTLLFLLAGLQLAVPHTGLAQESACQANPSPVDASDPSIIVSGPSDGASVTSPITVEGQARVFEAVVSFALYDASGTELSTATGQADEGQVLSPFTATIDFSVTADTPACLWVFEASAQDGSPVNVVQVELTLQPEPSLPPTGSGPVDDGGPPASWLWLLAGLAATTAGAGAALLAARGRRLRASP